MFICKNCKSIDKFELMFDPSYTGDRNFSESKNENGEITITVGAYSFTPTLDFMNSHAVCRYCSKINIWQYEKK